MGSDISLVGQVFFLLKKNFFRGWSGGIVLELMSSASAAQGVEVRIDPHIIFVCFLFCILNVLISSPDLPSCFYPSCLCLVEETVCFYMRDPK